MKYAWIRFDEENHPALLKNRVSYFICISFRFSKNNKLFQTKLTICET